MLLDAHYCILRYLQWRACVRFFCCSRHDFQYCFIFSVAVYSFTFCLLFTIHIFSSSIAYSGKTLTQTVKSFETATKMVYEIHTDKVAQLCIVSNGNKPHVCMCVTYIPSIECTRPTGDKPFTGYAVREKANIINATQPVSQWVSTQRLAEYNWCTGKEHARSVSRFVNGFYFSPFTVSLIRFLLLAPCSAALAFAFVCFCFFFSYLVAIFILHLCVIFSHPIPPIWFGCRCAKRI